MASLKDSETSLIESIRRLWDNFMLRPMLLGLAVVLVLSANVNTDVVQVPSTAQPQTTESQQLATPPLPLSSQEQDLLRRRRVTEANLTNHTLTSAHFFLRQPMGKLSAETSTVSEQG